MINRTKYLLYYIFSFVIGLIVGLSQFENIVNFIPEKYEKIGEHVTESGTKVDIIRTKGDGVTSTSLEAKNVKIPFFKNNYRTAMIVVEKIMYDSSKPILLKNPILYKYLEDGKTVKAKMRGDWGKIILDINDKESPLDTLEIWGNTTINIYQPSQNNLTTKRVLNEK